MGPPFLANRHNPPQMPAGPLSVCFWSLTTSSYRKCQHWEGAQHPRGEAFTRPKEMEAIATTPLTEAELREAERRIEHLEKEVEGLQKKVQARGR
jgi:hypothetical protein